MAQVPRPLDPSVSAQHYFGSELRRLRDRASLSQDKLGERIRYSGDTVSKVEKGERWPLEAQRFAADCDRILDSDGTLARLVPLVVAERRRSQSIPPTPGPGLEPPSSPSALSSFAVAALPPGPVPASLADIVALSAPPGDPAIDQPEDDQVLRLFLDLQARLGGDDLYIPLVRHGGRLSATQRQRSSRTRLAALGRLQQMAGWLAVDSNRHPQARQHLTTALYIAHEVDDTALAASALAYMSLQQVYLGDHGKALSLARTAADTAQNVVTPLVAAMLGTRLARAHARLGHRRDALAALDDAHTHLGRAGGHDEPLWISYVDDVEMAAQAGACYLDLGMTDQADVALRLALGLLDRSAPQRTRDRVHYLSRLAKASLLAGDLDRACGHADEALRFSETVGSARVLERIGEVGAALEPFAAHPAARQVRERISAATAPQPS